MSLETLTLQVITKYHANAIDIHNSLHALGLRTDEQAEEFNAKHVMALVAAYQRRGIDLIKKITTKRGVQKYKDFFFFARWTTSLMKGGRKDVFKRSNPDDARRRKSNSIRDRRRA